MQGVSFLSEPQSRANGQTASEQIAGYYFLVIPSLRPQLQ